MLADLELYFGWGPNDWRETDWHYFSARVRHMRMRQRQEASRANTRAFEAQTRAMRNG